MLHGAHLRRVNKARVQGGLVGVVFLGLRANEEVVEDLQLGQGSLHAHLGDGKKQDAEQGPHIGPRFKAFVLRRTG